MSVPTNPGAMLYTQGFGSRPENVEVPVYSNRDPSTASDTQYPIGKHWINVNNSVWVLLGLSTSNGVTTANWVEFVGSAGAVSDVDVKNPAGVVTNTVTPIAGKLIMQAVKLPQTPPDSDYLVTKDITFPNQIDIELEVATPSAAPDAAGTLDDAGIVAPNSAQFTVGTNGLLSLIGSSASPAVVSDTVDTFTAPAITATVVANASGDIRVKGASVAAGTNPVRSNSHAASEYTLEVQTSQAIAATDATKIGLAAFNSADFSVDANGFVSAIGNSTNWNVVSVNTAMDVNNGYIAVAPGGALTFSLPAASALGDIIELTLDGATSWQITQGAGQQIRFGNVETTAGVGGSITSTAAGDTIKLVCQTANLRWNVLSSIGALNVV